MNDICDPDEINRAADIISAAYKDAAISKAKRAEAESGTAFSRLVREELERRCLAYSADVN